MTLRLKVLLLVLLGNLIPFLSNAADSNSRQGFFFGMGPGGAYEVKELKKFGFGYNAMIGGGFSNRFILYYFAHASGYFYNTSGYGGKSTALAALEIAFKYFFRDDSSPYVALGVGAGLVSGQTITTLPPSLNSRDGVGPATTLGVGYEFRVRKILSIQTELLFTYIYADKSSWPFFSPLINLVFYF